MRRTVAALVAGCCLGLLPASLLAQGAERVVALGYGIDTTTEPVRSLVQLLARYLALPQPGFTPTADWHAAEQALGQRYDPASGFTDYREPATIVAIQPAWPDENAFVIKVLYARADSRDLTVRPTALQRFYAVRADSSTGAPTGAPTGATSREARWVLTSALARHTADWRRVIVGPITYHYPPGYSFNADRAADAARFVDSLASALGVSPPDRIPYYLAESTEAMARALGFDWLGQPSGATAGRGGWGGVDGIFSADPRVGENYRHELAHLVAQALKSPRGRHWLVEEGFASWVGGVAGGTPVERLEALSRFAAEAPEVSWAVLTSFATPYEVRYATGALLVRTVFERAGWAGVRQLLAVEGGEEPLLAYLKRELELTTSTFGTWWRSEVARVQEAAP